MQLLADASAVTVDLQNVLGQNQKASSQYELVSGLTLLRDPPTVDMRVPLVV